VSAFRYGKYDTVNAAKGNPCSSCGKRTPRMAVIHIQRTVAMDGTAEKVDYYVVECQGCMKAEWSPVPS